MGEEEFTHRCALRHSTIEAAHHAGASEVFDAPQIWNTQSLGSTGDRPLYSSASGIFCSSAAFARRNQIVSIAEVMTIKSE